jgi:hypothetical protein
LWINQAAVRVAVDREANDGTPTTAGILELDFLPHQIQGRRLSAN